jgi:hypothetical protein
VDQWHKWHCNLFWRIYRYICIYVYSVVLHIHLTKFAGVQLEFANMQHFLFLLIWTRGYTLKLTKIKNTHLIVQCIVQNRIHRHIEGRSVTLGWVKYVKLFIFDMCSSICFEWPNKCIAPIQSFYCNPTHAIHYNPITHSPTYHRSLPTYPSMQSPDHPMRHITYSMHAKTNM